METAYEDVMKTLQEMDEYAIKVFEEFCDAKLQNLLWLEEIEKDLEKSRETGILNFDLLTNSSDSSKEVSPPTSIQSSSPSKENNKLISSRFPQPTRQLRNALREPSQLINVQVQGTSNILLDNVVVKQERLTRDKVENVDENVSAGKTAVEIKKEQIEMPPPKPVRAIKKKKEALSKLESVRVKSERLTKKLRKELHLDDLEQSVVRESEVQVQEKETDLVIVDSDDEAPRPKRTRARTKTKKTEEVVESTRSTRTKTRAKKNLEGENQFNESLEDCKAKQNDDETPKAFCDSSDEYQSTSKPAAKSRKNLNQKRLRGSSSEDQDQATMNRFSSKSVKARKVDKVDAQEEPKELSVASSASNINNITVVLESKVKNYIPEVACNVTKVVETADRVAEEVILKDIMTDDEDIIDSPLQDKQFRVIKHVFSPYDNSPVKKKVEAFEKLGAVSYSATASGGRVTRAQQHATPTHKQLNKFSSKTALGSCERTNNRNLTPSTTSALKSRSALKSSQAEFRERELRRQQNEKEAIAKKEAVLQARMEEKKRKREERQLKAQQTRDALSKTKQSAFEAAERAKQEKLKQINVVKEDKLAKKREVSAQRQAAAYKKALEEKQKDTEKINVPSHLKVENQKELDKIDTPLYLKYKMPLLPTVDCYDSDDSEALAPVPPYWQLKKNQSARIIEYARLDKRKLFCARAQTVDLKLIFPTIAPAKLKRTSSAVWNKTDFSRLLEEGDINDSVFI